LSFDEIHKLVHFVYREYELTVGGLS